MSLRRLSLPDRKKPDRRVSDSDMRKATETASFIFRSPDKNRSLPKSQKRKHWNRQNEEEVTHRQIECVFKTWFDRSNGSDNAPEAFVLCMGNVLNVGIGSIVANTVALALNVPYVVLCQDNWNWLKITAIIIQAIVTLIMAYQQFKDFGSLRTDHVTSEANYAALYDMIKNELRKDSKHRQDAEHFIEWINKQMSDLKASSPLIPPKILVAYRKMIFGKNIADPEGIDEIFIFENDDNQEVPPVLTEVVVDTEEPTSMIFHPTK